MNAINSKRAFGFLSLLLSCVVAEQVFCADSPQGRLEKMALESDLVFKGSVISSSPVTNASFPDWGKHYTTTLEVISVIKGKVDTNVVVFQHITSGPNAWGGGTPPSHYIFEIGRSYIIFAVKADKPDWLYSPSTNSVAKPNEFRQPMRGEYAMRTLDARPLENLSIKDAHWFELNLLLNDANPTNQLYAIHQLDLMSKDCVHVWGHDDDFKRPAILKVLQPFITKPNNDVAVTALGCFQSGSDCADQLVPYASELIQIANDVSSTARRITAIAVLAGTKFNSVSNALPAWLHDSDKNVRAQAATLLSDFPGNFSEQASQELADDKSALVRAAIADTIGKGKNERLLPILGKLFADPVGRQKPIGPLTIAELEAGGRIVGVGSGTTMVDDPNYPGVNVGDVHTSAGYALLKFDVKQVAEILKTNLNDAGFRLQFLCKLAETDPKPWIGSMVEIMETRRERNVRKAEASGFPPNTYMYLSGAYNRCWNIIYNYLTGLPYAEFANGKSDRCLDMLELAGTTGSQEPTALYELYKLKGLNKRAAKFRSENGKYGGYSLNEFFDKIDVKYPNNGVIPDQ